MDHKVPLGMTAQEFDQFCGTLGWAARLDEIEDLDVRLQGSAARFFAGRHKQMAYVSEEIVTDFLAEWERYPELVELQQIKVRMASVWADSGARPLRRPFDAYYKLGISNVPSDYDVQISSDSLAARARARIEPLGLPEVFDIRHPSYRFIEKSLIYKVAPHLEIWRAVQTDLLHRRVTIAAFAGTGPERVEDSTWMSNHHQPGDWVLRTGGDRV